ncbi:MAG TPA: hypothetical protein VGO07_02890 [Candidatus Saccharimonadales bacterium]|jgi:hypothetical protein|nr:hypothetical protein [Candidatus Saccharimonadales bacterium]
MSAKRLYQLLLGSIGLCIVVLLAGMYISTAVLKKQSGQLVKAKTNSAVLDQKQQQLNKARADITKYKSLSEIAQNIVPQDKNQAQTVREIVAIAEANGIKLGSITFPSSTLGGVGVGSANAALSQLKPVKGIGGVYSLEIAIQSDTTQPSDYDQFISFLDALEHNRRTALVNGITILPDPTKPNKLSFTLNVSEYLKP